MKNKSKEDLILAEIKKLNKTVKKLVNDFEDKKAEEEEKLKEEQKSEIKIMQRLLPEYKRYYCILNPLSSDVSFGFKFFSFLYGLKQRWNLKKQNFKTINIKEDFSASPIGRHFVDSNFSGEEFREKLLKPKLEELAGREKLIVDIREVEGYASSFLDEAFGGLVQKGYFTKEELHKKLIIKDDEVYEFYTKIIWEMIDGAQSDTKKNLTKQIIYDTIQADTQ